MIQEVEYEFEFGVIDLNASAVNADMVIMNCRNINRKIIQEFESGIIGVYASVVDSNMPVATNRDGFPAERDQSLDVKKFRFNNAFGAKYANISTPGPTEIKGNAVNK